MVLRRDTKPANYDRIDKANRHAVEVYGEIKHLIKGGSSLDDICAFLINDTDLKTATGSWRWQRYQVSRIIGRVKKYRLCKIV